MADELTDSDVGKKVVTDDGDEIGRLAGVSDGDGTVDMYPGLTDQLRSKLGWTTDEGETDSHRLRPASVTDVSDDTIVISADRER
jgi:hypothetical protein